MKWGGKWRERGRWEWEASPATFENRIRKKMSWLCLSVSFENWILKKKVPRFCQPMPHKFLIQNVVLRVPRRKISKMFIEVLLIHETSPTLTNCCFCTWKWKKLEWYDFKSKPLIFMWRKATEASSLSEVFLKNGIYKFLEKFKWKKVALATCWSHSLQ